jgi:hypothetical protein
MASSSSELLPETSQAKLWENIDRAAAAAREAWITTGDSLTGGVAGGAASLAATPLVAVYIPSDGRSQMFFVAASRFAPDEQGIQFLARANMIYAAPVSKCAHIATGTGTPYLLIRPTAANRQTGAPPIRPFVCSANATDPLMTARFINATKVAVAAIPPSH